MAIFAVTCILKMSVNVFKYSIVRKNMLENKEYKGKITILKKVSVHAFLIWGLSDCQSGCNFNCGAGLGTGPVKKVW